MSVHISDKPEMNVVNVGDEVTQDIIDALGNASGPTSLNPFLTVSAGDSAYLEKDGGGTVVGTVIVDTDGTVGGNTSTITGTSITVDNFGIGSISIDPVLGITFADGTSQSTAATNGVATKLQTTVFNNSGVTIPKFSVVYINGRHGNQPTVALSKADAELTSRSTFGFTTADIADQASGTVVQVGLLEGVNTFGLTEGALIFLSPSVAGGWTTTQPYSPNHYVNVGTIVRAHPSLGTIQVRITNSNELDELSDVSASSAVSGDILVNDGSGTWVAQAPPTSSTSTAGKIQLATTAEARSALNNTKAMTAFNVNERIMHGGTYGGMFIGLTTNILGTGAAATGSSTVSKSISGPTSANVGVGHATMYNQFYLSGGIGKGYNTGIDWSKKVELSARMLWSNAPTDANSIFRYTLGKNNSVLTPATLSQVGIGIQRIASGAINIICHNGSGLTTLATSFTPTQGQLLDVNLISDGSGNVTCYINGTQVGTTTGGPTAVGGSLGNMLMFECQNLATITGTPQALLIANFSFFVGT